MCFFFVFVASKKLEHKRLRVVLKDDGMMRAPRSVSVQSGEVYDAVDPSAYVIAIASTKNRQGRELTPMERAEICDVVADKSYAQNMHRVPHRIAIYSQVQRTMQITRDAQISQSEQKSNNL